MKRMLTCLLVAFPLLIAAMPEQASALVIDIGGRHHRHYHHHHHRWIRGHHER